MPAAAATTTTTTTTTLEAIRRNYCQCVISAYQTLQIYVIRADIPAEISLEQLYVNLTMSGRIIYDDIFSDNFTNINFQRIDDFFSVIDNRLAELMEEKGRLREGESVAVSHAIDQHVEGVWKTLGQFVIRWEKAKAKTDDGSGELSRQRVQNVGEALQDTKRLVVLGEPGCGKTTLLKYLALNFASDKAQERLGIEESRLPILLRFWDDSKHASCDRRKGAVRVLSWIEKQSRLIGFDPPDGFWAQALEEGACVLLCDGLDEIPDLVERGRAVQDVEAFVNAYPNNRYVISSRRQGYRNIPHFSSGFTEAYVNDFSDADVETFVKHWGAFT